MEYTVKMRSEDGSDVTRTIKADSLETARKMAKEATAEWLSVGDYDEVSEDDPYNVRGFFEIDHPDHAEEIVLIKLTGGSFSNGYEYEIKN